MQADRYGNPLTTVSAVARDAYVQAGDALLAANAGAEAGFRAAIAADPRLALAHASLGRTLQLHGRIPEARQAMATALSLAEGVTEREKSHLAIHNELINGKPVVAFAMTGAHIKSWPRDAIALAPSCGVFGLIGFSGQAGREQALYDFLDPLAAHYGDDWFFRTVHAFAEVEVGEIERARTNTRRALELNPRSANAAHTHAHVHYEAGEPAAGLAFMRQWNSDYPKEAPLHCHMHWHEALWSLEQGETEEAWRVYREHLAPGGSWGPAINTLSDVASFLFRAELMGEPRRDAEWQQIARFAAQHFAGTGLPFAAVHGALAYAMAGDGEALTKAIEGARGPAGPVVAGLSKGFAAFARQDWQGAVTELAAVRAEHERIGGSRAQRDLVEHALYCALLRLGRADAAERLLRQARPRATVVERLG